MLRCNPPTNKFQLIKKLLLLRTKTTTTWPTWRCSDLELRHRIAAGDNFDTQKSRNKLTLNQTLMDPFSLARHSPRAVFKSIKLTATLARRRNANEPKTEVREKFAWSTRKFFSHDFDQFMRAVWINFHSEFPRLKSFFAISIWSGHFSSGECCVSSIMIIWGLALKIQSLIMGNHSRWWCQHSMWHENKHLKVRIG